MQLCRKVAGCHNRSAFATVRTRQVAQMATAVAEPATANKVSHTDRLICQLPALLMQLLS
jgi:hypothetical protein